MIRILATIAFFAYSIFGVRGAAAQTLAQKLVTESPDQIANDAIRFGDPRRGALAFYQPTMNCARCHEPQGDRRLGPDLAERREVTPQHLLQSILDPSADIRKGFETAFFQMADGTTFQGILVERTASGFVLDRIEQLEKPIEFANADVEDWKLVKQSSMPDGLVNLLADRQQFLDLVSYLVEIAAKGSKRAAELKPSGAMAILPLPEYESRIDHAGLIRSLNEEAHGRGEETYRLRCASCHGTVAAEGSMPTSLRFATGAFKNGNDPFRMYQTLTHGFGMMNPQRWMVPQQKYEVIHYIREHFLKPRNPGHFFEINENYLNSLPTGDTQGPKPVVSRPWTLMDYGPSLINTIEVSNDGSNIAQKGIAIRLDDGPGGVESGRHWLMYDHDTMRVAGAWTGGFINYEGIHFNGVHGRHPQVAGAVQFSNPTGPGWGRPEDSSFTDSRLVGRDKKRYGPLDRKWAQYKGLYRYGRQTIIEYTVGKTRLLESPGLSFVGEQPVYLRTLDIGPRNQDLVLQIAKIPGGELSILDSGRTVIVSMKDSNLAAATTESKSNRIIRLDGNSYGEIENGDAFDMTNSDFTICGRIKTRHDGTIISQTKQQEEWAPDGKTLFLRGGRLTFDIGWVGAASAKRKIHDNQWHDVVMTWRASDGRVQFYIDGESSGGPGYLQPAKKRRGQVMRIGFTNPDFPADPGFEGSLTDLRFYQRILDQDEIKNAAKRSAEALVGRWQEATGNMLPNTAGNGDLNARLISQGERADSPSSLLIRVSNNLENGEWIYVDDCLRLKIPAGKALPLVVAHCPVENPQQANEMDDRLPPLLRHQSLSPLTKGGPANWPQELQTQIIRGNDDGPFAVDVLTRPEENPWRCQLRLTGLDFLPDGNSMVLSAWDGSIWHVSGISDDRQSSELTWRRVAAGLFQPLGIKWIEGKIYVTCRDQLAVLHDLNGDGEMDWYQSLNNDHQVTEHFHEFAMGLQTDEEGNFYYAKSARHALPAVVPHHGTLLKISADGERTEILANGFRAANGVCLNPDGTFVVTDQEGHWNPKNRINWVRPGGFYGNMFGYHDVTDDSDEAMDDPLCWITNSFDRSPAELLWVDSKKWGPLNGSLLNFSYGYGQVYVVPHEEVDGQMQGGMCALPLDRFPTGVMRGRFHPGDGQLYCCGMFAWAGNQQQPGGLYRIRYSGEPVHLPVNLRAKTDGLEIGFSGRLDPCTVSDPNNFAITSWDLKRTKNYGSDHYNEQRLTVERAELQSDGKTIRLIVPQIKPTWGMEIQYSLKTAEGKELRGKIHNTIHHLGD